MESLRRNFFNGIQEGDRKIAWVKWSKVLASKLRGLEFPRFLLSIGLLSFQVGMALLSHRFGQGSRPSWLWNNLLHGRDLLLRGVRWQVGNRQSISFWTQKWVPFNEDFFIHSPLGPFPNGGKVLYFIGNGAWNTRMLRKYVSVREAEIILGIPISQTGCPDKLVWHFDSKGQYTVKSGYKQALLLKRSHQAASKADTSSKPPQQFWKTLWNIHTQPKIKVFTLKAITNSVATMDNLFKRNLSPCPKCPICNTCVETIEHLLFECAWTRPVWFGSSLCFRNHPSGTSVSLRFQRFVDIFKSSSEASRILLIVATICWFIWRSRCAFVYDNVDLSPKHTLASINAQLNEFDKIMASNLTTKAFYSSTELAVIEGIELAVPSFTELAVIEGTELAVPSLTELAVLQVYRTRSL
ncbi:reverse transcriptase [Tanacetum coccineum]|uniref:Reverse transcriptase n=1 Tax=Tanacetum coccineum TaxID=301880 RepID=A0ABQ4X0I2_9ASTR